MSLVCKKTQVSASMIGHGEGGDLPAGMSTTPGLNSGGVMLLGSIGLLAGLSMSPVLGALFEQWVSIAGYDYCFLIGPICIVWTYLRMRGLVLSSLEPDARLLAALVGTLFLQYVLWQGHSELGAQVLVPPIFWFSIAAVSGWPVGRRLIAPIAYFYFAIPVWDQLLPLLQQLTIFGAKFTMQMAAIPVEVSGNMVMIKEGTFEVLYGCSGLRYVVVALSLVSLVATTERIRMRSVPFLVLTTVALAILANWLRVFIVMYAGHVTGMRHYFVSDNHKSLGEVIFACLLLVIYFISRKLPVMAIVDLDSTKKKSDIPDAPNPKLKGIGVFVISVLGVFAALNVRAGLSADGYLVPKLKPIPVTLGKWQGPFPGKTIWQPTFTGVSDSQLFTYVSERGHIDVYLNVYGVQRQGSELVFFSNTIYSPGSWQLVGWNVWNALQSGIGLQPLMTEQLTKGGEQWLMGQMYVVGGFRTSSGLIAQAIYGSSTLIHAVPAGVIALAIMCQSDCQYDRELMLEFWRTNGDKILGSIPRSLTVSEGIT